MPTVFRFNGFRVTIYPNDHRPAHVHVISSENEAVFNLNCPTGPVEVRENFGFSSSEITYIRRKLNEHLGILCQAWEEIHGAA